MQILQGDALTMLRTLSDNSVHMCCTSPPYYFQRDYGVTGQYGMEKTLDCLGWATGNACGECYICVQVAVFREVRRALRQDGTLFVDIGDSYAKGTMGRNGKGWAHAWDSDRPDFSERYKGGGPTRSGNVPMGLKPKDLCGVPWRFALALQADGWYWRSTIVWHKPNCMPGSQQDRPTTDWEPVLLFSKARRYFWDGEGVREPAHNWGTRNRALNKHFGEPYHQNGQSPHHGLTNGNHANTGRTLRTVWPIPTVAGAANHFASYPPALVERCILAGTSAYGVCGECGSPYSRCVDVSYVNPGNRTTNGPQSMSRKHESPGFPVRLERDVQTTGWTCSCSHTDAPRSRPLVLDPYLGSGTTLLVAQRLGRDGIGIDLHPEYVALAWERLRQEAPLFYAGQEASMP